MKWSPWKQPKNYLKLKVSGSFTIKIPILFDDKLQTFLISYPKPCHVLKYHLLWFFLYKTVPVQSLDVIAYNPEASFWERVQTNARQRLLAVTILCSVIMFLYEGLMVCIIGFNNKIKLSLEFECFQNLTKTISMYCQGIEIINPYKVM